MQTTLTDHHTHMQTALKLAEKGRYTASPNPMVGCVIVKDGVVVGQGYHIRTGGAHAEIFALQEAKERARGATVYVTLEPCCHYGKTPPCTQALIEAGVKEVYVATIDPNPLMAGKGIAALQAAGIKTSLNLYAKEATTLNQFFFHFMQHQRPFVIAKWAMSLDGKTITHPSDTSAITGQATKEAVHLTRQQVDAILIGSKTATQDDPLLTVRYANTDTAFIKQPLRIIVSSDAVLPLNLKLFAASAPAKTIVATTTQASRDACDALRQKQIEVWQLPADREGQVDLLALLHLLAKQNITSLLVEGGATLHAAFFKANLVDQIDAYIAPIIIGGEKTKKQVVLTPPCNIGEDYYFSARFAE